jgi:glycosyltransferase involved in cell wall biosynthesis
MGEGTTANEMQGPSVSVCVASLNTARATELCIRSARHLAGYPFSMRVGDCGSSDGSTDMLRSFEAKGWISLEVAASGRDHSAWLDKWLHSCEDDLVVFVDSDIEFRRQGWLRELVEHAGTTDAAMVAAEMLPEIADFPAPRAGMSEEDRAEMLDRWFDGHEVVRLASRPAPWLLLLDLRKVRPLDLSFAYELAPADIPEGIMAFDVGGGLFRRLQSSKMVCEVMPRSYQDAYHHYGGL